MSGIGNYFHGERGRVADLCWAVDSDGLVLRLELDDDPHRRFAYAYGSDIGIDPALERGQQAVYLRLDGTSGVWTDEHSQAGEQLNAALGRASSIDRFMRGRHDAFYFRAPWARLFQPFLRSKLAVPVRFGSTPPGDPGLPTTVFLSYSSSNVVLARRIFDELRNEGKADVWFDLAHPGESSTHDEHVERWLKKAIQGCRVFVVLLTPTSVESKWVRKEIDSAVSRASASPDFHLVLMKLADVDSPEVARDAKFIIDCKGLYFGDVYDAVYAGVYGRRTRAQWLAENPGYRRELESCSPLVENPYYTFESDGGVALALEWTKPSAGTRWMLRYRDAQDHLKVVSGPRPVNAVNPHWHEDVVDPGIREGDRIGMGRADFLGWPSRYWMRSGSLDLTFDQVRDAYQARVTQSA